MGGLVRNAYNFANEDMPAEEIVMKIRNIVPELCQFEIKTIFGMIEMVFLLILELLISLCVIISM